jgi:hypothetical protein
MKKLLIALSFAGTFILACKTSSELVSLKLQMPKGSRYEYTTTADMEMTQGSGAIPMKMKTLLTFTYLFDVANDSAGWKTITSTIRGMKMDANAMGMKMSMDTDNPSDTSGPLGMLNKMFGGLKGKQFAFTMDEQGKIGKVSGLKEIMESMIPPDAKGGDIKKMGGGFSEESFRQSIQQAFSIFPMAPVKVGESWKDTTEMNQNGVTLKSISTYTLESVDDGNAVVKVNSVYEPGRSKSNGADMSVKGKSNGKYTYEMASGMILDGNMNMSMDMEAEAEGQKTPMKMETKLSIKGKKQ